MCSLSFIKYISIQLCRGERQRRLCNLAEASKQNAIMWRYISNNSLLLDVVLSWVRNETVIERKEESKQAVVQPFSVLSLIKACFSFP